MFAHHFRAVILQRETGRVSCPSLTIVSFQILLHHCYVCLLKRICCSGTGKVFSLKFTTTNTRRQGISFWEGNDLVIMKFALCSRDVSLVKIGVLFVIVFSIIESCFAGTDCYLMRGGNAEFIKALDKNRSLKAGIRYPFNFLPF